MRRCQDRSGQMTQLSGVCSVGDAVSGFGGGWRWGFWLGEGGQAWWRWSVGRGWRLVVGLVVGLVVLVGAGGALALSPAFTPVAGSPFGTGLGPSSVAFSPGGGLLATANANDNTVSVFSVGSGGALTPVAGLAVCDRQRPAFGGVQSGWGAARDRKRKSPTRCRCSRSASGRRADPGLRLAVCDRHAPVVGGVQSGWGAARDRQLNNNTVSVFSVGSGGALTPVTGSPFATGSSPFSVAFSPGGGLLATANASRRYGVGVLGRLRRRADPGCRARRSRPAAARLRWRSVRVGGCSRPPTQATTRCRCSRSAPAAR